MSNKLFKALAVGVVLGALTGTVLAKLPVAAPSDEAKAKAAEAAAKTAWVAKVDGFKLCKAQDAAAAAYFKQSKVAGKEAKVGVPGAPCTDPGPFVYSPAGAQAVPAAAAASAVPAKKS